MTTGVTLYDWSGKPALIQDGQVRYIASAGQGWTGATPETAVAVATVRTQGVSIGEGAFADRFSGPPWNVPDLDGWYQRRDPNRTLTWRDIRRY